MNDQPLLLFEKPGPGCPAGVLRAVRGRLEAGGPSHLVVASISGRTAFRLARDVAMPGLSIVCVTGPPAWDVYPQYESPRPEPAIRRQLEELGGTVVDRTI